MDSLFTETIYLTATTKGGKKARRELIIKSVKEGPAPKIDNPAPPKKCSECAKENLSKICIDTSKE